MLTLRVAASCPTVVSTSLLICFVPPSGPRSRNRIRSWTEQQEPRIPYLDWLGRVVGVYPTWRVFGGGNLAMPVEERPRSTLKETISQRFVAWQNAFQRAEVVPISPPT